MIISQSTIVKHRGRLLEPSPCMGAFPSLLRLQLRGWLGVRNQISIFFLPPLSKTSRPNNYDARVSRNECRDVPSAKATKARAVRSRVQHRIVFIFWNTTQDSGHLLKYKSGQWSSSEIKHRIVFIFRSTTQWQCSSCGMQHKTLFVSKIQHRTLFMF